MISWEVQKVNRLLTEVKNKLAGVYSTKEVRWSIEHNRCFLNNRMERFGSTPVKKGDCISIHIEEKREAYLDLKRVLFEDESIWVYDKPPFCTSEEIACQLNGRLVHRLDRDTSGLFLIAKNETIQRDLERQFRQRLIKKKYLSWVTGRLQGHGSIKGNMRSIYQKNGLLLWGLSKKGLWSETEWNCIKSQKGATLLQCMPITGRTHQIRVHLSSIGHPIIGDPIYGSREQNEGIFRPLLHAHELTFTHPATNQRINFLSPPPPDFDLIRI